jgi:ABC-type multidrug transport system ATPase subunit
MPPVIEVAGVRKTYGQTVAVDEASFAVLEGEIFGLIGPNGAGKTTTMECIEGIRKPDRGVIKVLGLDPFPPGLPTAGPRRRPAPAGSVAEAHQGLGSSRPLGIALQKEIH